MNRNPLVWKAKIPVHPQVISRKALREAEEQPAAAPQGTSCELNIYQAEMEHTGFSPGDSGASQAALTSSGSFTLPEPKQKMRREGERLEQRSALQAAPATTAEWSHNKQDPALADDNVSVRSCSRRSASSSSSAEQELEILEKERQVAKIELKVLRAKKARSNASSRSRGSGVSRRRSANGARSSASALPTTLAIPKATAAGEASVMLRGNPLAPPVLRGNLPALMEDVLVQGACAAAGAMDIDCVVLDEAPRSSQPNGQEGASVSMTLIQQLSLIHI